MDSVKVSDEVTSTTSLVSRAFIGVAQSGCCSKNAGMFVFGTHLRVSVGFRPYIFHGVFHPMYQEERGGVFTDLSGGAR